MQIQIKTNVMSLICEIDLCKFELQETEDRLGQQIVELLLSFKLLTYSRVN